MTDLSLTKVIKRHIERKEGEMWGNEEHDVTKI